NEWLLNLLAPVEKLAPDSVQYETTAYANPNARPVVLGRRLCAAVVVLEAAGLDHPQFRQSLEWCIGQVARRDDFRLFVLLDGVTPEEFRERYTRDTLLANLMDTVQVADQSSAHQVRSELAKYLERLGDIRDHALWRFLRIATTIALGSVAGL